MFKRLFFLGIMMAAVGLPYALTASSSFWSSLASRSSDSDTQTSSASGAAATSTTQHPGAAVAGTQSPKVTPLEGRAVQDLAEVLRFDGTPAWVMARWPRVSSGLAELDLQGYRVPLVTGTGAGDLAGSLTYYFNKEQKVAYITFRGTTGDPRKLVAHVTSRFSFVQQKTDDPSLGLYQVKWNGKPQSELRIRPVHVVRANQPHARYEVDLAMQRP
jgi:hypothetical protein